MTISIESKPLRPRYLAIFLFIMVAAGTIIYSNTFESPFLFDDDVFIVNDYAIRMTEFSWGALKNAALEGRPAHRYLPNMSFAINYYFGRLNPFGYHVANLVIHLLTGLFLFFFIAKTLHVCPARSRNIHPEIIAFFAALLWLVQPVGTQAVTYLCQRMASMVALFYILSLLLYVKARVAMIRKPENFLAPGLYFFGCFLSALCAIATKENAGTLPLVILLYEWFFFQDLRLGWSRNQILWGLLFIMAFGGVVVWYMGGNPMIRLLGSYQWRDFTMFERTLTQFRIVVYYISLFLWAPPGRLNLDHDYPLSISFFSPPTTFICMIAIFFLFAVAASAARKERLMSFCIFWFFITQATESTIIGIELIFEHRTYIPFMMASLMAVMLMFRLFKNKLAVYLYLSLLILLFCFWTHQRNIAWQDPVTFWSDAAAKSPRKFRPHNDLGVALYDAGDIAGAISQYEKALRINPYHADAHNNMGNALFYKDKDVGAAIQSFGKALAIDPNHIPARNNLANALMQQGNINEAVRHLQIILSKQPNHVEANINMGAALSRLGRIDEALSHYQAAVNSGSYNPEVFNNMGVLFVQKSMFREAMAHFQKALLLRPGYENAINNLRRLEQMAP